MKGTFLMDVEVYEIKESKNGLKVPVIDGVYLHSIYDPQTEGKALLKRHQDSFEEKSSILILGLGYGYHIEENY